MIRLMSVLVTNPKASMLSAPGRRFPASDSPPEQQVVERLLSVMGLPYDTPDVISWLRLQRTGSVDLSWAKLWVPRIELAIEVSGDRAWLSTEPLRVIDRALDAWRLMVELAADDRARPPGFIYRPL